MEQFMAADLQRDGWDAIVIGSGLGGLSCAAYLCAAGKRTLVLEAHYVAGGNSQVFRRSRRGRHYEFDVGVHYIGECGKEGSITRILRGCGLEDRVRFRPLDPDGYTILIFPDLTFRVPAGWDRYRARLLETFPAEAVALGQVLDIFEAITETYRQLTGRDRPAADVFSTPQAQAFMTWGLRPVTELFREYGLSHRAQAVLLGEQGDYAVPPSRTPVGLAAGLTDHYMRGAFYPEGGGQMIAARLIEAIRAYGGTVRTKAPVERVRVEHGRVVGVTLASGEQIDAPVVVSNADLKRTVTRLVGERHFSPDTVDRVRAFRMSLPLFVVYLAVAVDYVAAGRPNSNLMIWGTYDIDGVYTALEAGRMPDEDFVYITIASLKDPTNPRLAPPGHSNLQIMTLVPPDYAVFHADPGGVESWTYRRDPEYRRRKQALTERLLSAAERFLPDLRAHIDWQEAATPATLERYTHATGGTSYGIEFAYDQMGPLRIGPATEIGGLYLCGASAPAGHGIGGVLRGGVAAAAAILERDLMREVVKGHVLGDPDRLPPISATWDPWRQSH
jgi:all-trans-retinol 13,14-reductase